MIPLPPCRRHTRAPQPPSPHGSYYTNTRARTHAHTQHALDHSRRGGATAIPRAPAPSPWHQESLQTQHNTKTAPRPTKTLSAKCSRAMLLQPPSSPPSLSPLGMASSSTWRRACFPPLWIPPLPSSPPLPLGAPLGCLPSSYIHYLTHTQRPLFLLIQHCRREAGAARAATRRPPPLYTQGISNRTHTHTHNTMCCRVALFPPWPPSGFFCFLSPERSLVPPACRSRWAESALPLYLPGRQSAR